MKRLMCVLSCVTLLALLPGCWSCTKEDKKPEVTTQEKPAQNPADQSAAPVATPEQPMQPAETQEAPAKM